VKTEGGLFFPVQIELPRNRDPEIVGESASFIVVYKPPRIHSVPLTAEASGETLLDFAAKLYPEVRSVLGWKAVEGGLVHRLDYQTRGLVLIARTQDAMDAFMYQQKQDQIIKEYTAVSAGAGEKPPGFPPCAQRSPEQAVIKSAFRPYGKGRKAVRPVLPPLPAASGPGDTGGGMAAVPGVYKTGIVSRAENGRVFRLRISRGYRHQIRCHLAWIGRPIMNDSLYGGVPGGDGTLALCADKITFTDPDTGENREYTFATREKKIAANHRETTNFL
jgi:23S rRNA pseudouridine1911/1915/1917 synthase